MHKTFTKELIQSLKVITLGLALGVGINYAFAVDWTPPTANPPANNAAAPINVSGSAQTKLNAEKSLKFLSSSENTALTLSNTSSASGARALAIASGGMFSIGNVDLWGNLNVGIGGLNTPGIASNFYVPVNVQPTLGALPPFSINLSGNATGPNRENAISLVTSAPSSKIGIIQNVPDFFLWNYNGGGENANIIAKIGKFTRGVFTSSNPALYNELGGTPGNQNLAYGLGVEGRAFILGDSHDQDAFLKISDNASGTPVTSLSVDPQGTQGKVNVHVNGIVTTNDIKIVGSSTTPGNNRILTSDADGDGTWKSMGSVFGNFVQGDNVKVLGRYYDNNGSNKVHDAWIYCPANYMAITGGGDCEDGGIRISQPIHSDFGSPGAYAGGPGWSDQSSSNPGGYTYVPGTDKVVNNGRFPQGWQLACTSGGSNDLRINVVCLYTGQ